MNVKFVKAELEHCKPIADNMRECDKNEVWAASHHSPMEALTSSLEMSEYCETALLDGVPCAMYGVGEIDHNYGIPWLLATDNLKLWWLQFLKRSPLVISEMLSCRDYLFNHVDARNETSIKWLKWLGFEFASEPQPFGLDGLPFYYFALNKGKLI